MDEVIGYLLELAPFIVIALAIRYQATGKWWF